MYGRIPLSDPNHPRAMVEREQFLAAIEAEPENQEYRLVYADWLDEHGEEDSWISDDGAGADRLRDDQHLFPGCSR